MPSSITRIVLVAAAVLLAGCGGFGGPATTETPTATETTTASHDTPTATETTTGTTTTLEAADADPEAVRGDVVAAMSAVESYRLDAAVERTQSANGVTRTVTVESSGVFDRTDRELRIEQTTKAAGRTVDTTTYVVGGTLYQQSEAFVRAYSSEWIFLENASQQWEMLDTMSRQRAVLANASVTLRGATSVDGQRVYVLALDVDEAAYNRILESRLENAATNVSVNVTDAAFQYVVATDSGRLLESTGTINSTVVSRGQELAVTERIALEFDDYETEVDITLPDAADTAVDITNRTATG